MKVKCQNNFFTEDCQEKYSFLGKYDPFEKQEIFLFLNLIFPAGKVTETGSFELENQLASSF